MNKWLQYGNMKKSCNLILKNWKMAFGFLWQSGDYIDMSLSHIPSATLITAVKMYLVPDVMAKKIQVHLAIYY